MTLTLAVALRNSLANTLGDSLDAGAGPGVIEIRSGTRPADPDTTATGTLLATVTCVDPAFAASSSGSKTLSDPAAVTAVAAGTATWFRAKDSTGAAKFDGRVTATGGGGDLTLTTTSITVGLSVDVTGGTLVQPLGTAD